MASLPDFGRTTEATTVAAAFPEQIKGKTFVITGVSPNGLGQSTAEALAAHQPALLILTGRTRSKVDAVIDLLKQKHSAVKYRYLEMDLSSLESVRKAAEEIKGYADVPKIDVVICNAGVMWIQEHETSVDGIEMQFATNHLGHFLFVNLILAKLITAAKSSPSGTARVVNVSSTGANFSPVRFSDINFAKEQSALPESERANLEAMVAYGMASGGIYNPVIAYGQSKTANILFSLALTARLFDKYKIKSYALHPGGILTDLWRHTEENYTKQIVASQEATGGFKTLEQGSSTTLVAALDPGLPSPTTAGENLFLDNCQLAEIVHWARDPELAEKLWRLSEELVGQTFSP